MQSTFRIIAQRLSNAAQSSRFSTKSFAFIFLTIFTGIAHAQQYSQVPVSGGGTLYYQINTQFGLQCPGDPTIQANGFDFTGFTYTDQSGHSDSLSGDATAYWDENNRCHTQTPPLQLTGPSYTITFNAQYADQDNSTASIAITPVTGAIDPKYIVLGVTYAPPGARSNVNYGGSTIFGTSTSLSKTFTNQTSVSVSAGAGVSIFGQGVSVTGTASTSFSQESDTSSSFSVNKTTSSSIAVPGPSSSAAGVDHDYDIVWVWLNPQVNITVNSATSLQWTGYSYDMRDPAAEMDVVPLYVAWLKNSSLIPANVASVLARSWDTAQGGLTNTDYATILQRDPFTAGASYNPNTDPTHRFDLQYGETFNYEPPPAGGQPITEAYALNYQTTTTAGQGGQDSYQVGISIDVKATAGFLAKITADLKTSDTTTWVNKWSTDSNNVSGQSASLSITGPAYTDNYNGPTQIQVWKDNVYGTFMFYPSN